MINSGAHGMLLLKGIANGLKTLPKTFIQSCTRQFLAYFSFKSKFLQLPCA